MHALEMLFPSERLTAQPALRTQRIAALKATVESKRSASQPVTTAKQSALLGADADASIPQSAQLPTQSHAAPATSDCGLPRMLAQLQQQQKLTSPASRVASAPFTGPVPHAVAQQQAGKQEQSGSQQHPSKAGTPLAGGPLQLSLSVEQIVLLQAAADNAQRYLDSDSPPDKADADPEQNTQGTGKLAASLTTYNCTVGPQSCSSMDSAVWLSCGSVTVGTPAFVTVLLDLHIVLWSAGPLFLDPTSYAFVLAQDALVSAAA